MAKDVGFYKSTDDIAKELIAKKAQVIEGFDIMRDYMEKTMKALDHLNEQVIDLRKKVYQLNKDIKRMK